MLNGLNTRKTVQKAGVCRHATVRALVRAAFTLDSKGHWTIFRNQPTHRLTNRWFRFSHTLSSRTSGECEKTYERSSRATDKPDACRHPRELCGYSPGTIVTTKDSSGSFRPCVILAPKKGENFFPSDASSMKTSTFPG